MAPIDALLNVPELFENVLLRLDLKTLLLSQRVNKQFKAMIEGTTSLQQALFFQQVQGKQIEVRNLAHKEAMNPMLPWTHRPMVLSNTTNGAMAVSIPAGIAPRGCAFKATQASYNKNFGFALSHQSHDQWRTSINILGKKDSRQSWTGIESWRHMYLFRGTFECYSAFHYNDNNFERVLKFCAPDESVTAKTMGHWFDTACKIARRQGRMPYKDTRKSSRIAEKTSKA